MTKKGILTVISGFSGAGKGTIVRELVDRYGYAVSISATTRDPRAGEQDGVHYFFKTKEEFEQMIADGALIEYASYVDNYYGTPKDYVMQKLEQGIDVILEIEMQGALKVKERFPEVSLIFITPPDAKVLRERLEGRGTETQDVIDDLNVCVEQIHGLIQALHWKCVNQQGQIAKMKGEFANKA